VLIALIIIGVILFWFACGVCGYLVFRWDWRREFNEWTVRDRRAALWQSAWGPSTALAAVITMLASRDRASDNRPAKW